METKKRAVVSYENMSEELAAAFAEKYPRGFNDYLADVVKIVKPDGTPIYTVTIELPEAIYLVKVKMKTDDAEDLERWLDADNDSGSEDGGDSGELPDDNISQYSTGEEDSAE